MNPREGSATDFDEFFDSVAELATSVFEKKGEHLPLFYLRPADSDDIAIVDASWSDLPDKTAKFTLMRIGIELGVTQACALVHEMWFAQYDKGKGPVDVAGMTPPSQRADRKEMLMMVCVDAVRHRIATWEIKRPHPKAKPTLGKINFLGDYTLQTLSAAFRGLIRDEGTKQ